MAGQDPGPQPSGFPSTNRRSVLSQGCWKGPVTIRLAQERALRDSGARRRPRAFGRPTRPQTPEPGSEERGGRLPSGLDAVAPSLPEGKPQAVLQCQGRNHRVPLSPSLGGDNRHRTPLGATAPLLAQAQGSKGRQGPEDLRLSYQTLGLEVPQLPHHGCLSFLLDVADRQTRPSSHISAPHTLLTLIWGPVFPSAPPCPFLVPTWLQVPSAWTPGHTSTPLACGAHLGSRRDPKCMWQPPSCHCVGS